LKVRHNAVDARKVLVGFRPERARVHLSCQDAINRLEGRITSRVFLGGRNVYEVECQGNVFRVETLTSYQVNQQVQVELPPGSLRVFEAD
jgi:ABC-type sugar transport system ATPase subunit